MKYENMALYSLKVKKKTKDQLDEIKLHHRETIDEIISRLIKGHNKKVYAGARKNKKLM